MTCFSMQIGVALLLLIGGAIVLATSIDIMYVIIRGIDTTISKLCKDKHRLQNTISTVLAWIFIGFLTSFIGYIFWNAAEDVMREYFHVCMGG